MRGHKYLYPKTIELNINIDENSLRNGSIPVEPLRLATCHRQKPFPTQTFIKKDLLSNKFDKENNENTNVFSNLHSKKIKVCDQSDFQSNLKKKDDNYIKNLRGVLKKELFKKGHKKYESNYNNNSVKNEVNLNLKAKNHFEDCDEDDKEMVFQSFQENFLFDLKTCKKMLAYLDFLDLLNFQYVCKKTFSSQFKSVIKRLVCKYVIKGINKKEQYIYYDHFIHFKVLKKKFPSQFKSNLEKPSNEIKDIQKDIDRTYHCSKHLSSLSKY